MSRYNISAGLEGEYEPGSGGKVLRNKMGIKSLSLMHNLSLAIVHAELLLVHPFREGNGRLARWLADIMAAQAGLPLPDYGFTGRGSKARKARYLGAVINPLW